MAAEYFTREGVLVVRPGNRLDTTTSPEVDRELGALIEAGSTKLVFDFEHTNYVSSAGLRVMMKAAKAAAAAGGGVGICHANAGVREVLDLCGFAALFTIGKTLDKTIRSL